MARGRDGMSFGRARAPRRHALWPALVAVFGAGLWVTGCADPTTLYVDIAASNCLDGGSGTSTQPYCTIKKAATVASAGQTVLVSSGAYGGDVVVSNSGTSSFPIVFQSAPGAIVTVSGGTNGFKVSSKSWITVRGFSVSQTVGIGIYLNNADHITVDQNTVFLTGQRVVNLTSPGIKLYATSYSVVSGNITHDNSDHGIQLSAGSNENVVKSNLTYGNARGIARAAEGILLVDSEDNTVSGNISRNNEDSGIGLWNGSNNNTLSNNLVYENGDHGIDVLSSTSGRIVSNTVYANVDSGVELQGGAGADLANNISMDNGIDSPRTAGNIRVVDSESASQTTMDYDLLYLNSGSILIDYLGVTYSSLSTFQAAVGQELSGTQGDPKFQGATSADFHLLSASPAIDSANAGAPAQPITDADGQARVDDPLTPDTGVGPRSYDDRGAYEYAPTG